jgi:hypothetical protein
VLAYAAGGCDPDRPERIAIPRRTGGHGDLEAHAANVKLACAEAAVPV